MLELGARVQTLHAMHERTDEKLAAMDEKGRPPVKRHWDAKLIALLQAAWTDEPVQRPSFSAILEELNALHVASFKCTLEEAIKRGGVDAAGYSPSGCCELM